MDNLSRGHQTAVAPEVRFYEGNIGDKNLVKKICGENKIEAVMHFSAFAYVGESVEKPQMYYEKTIPTKSEHSLMLCLNPVSANLSSLKLARLMASRSMFPLTKNTRKNPKIHMASQSFSASK